VNWHTWANRVVPPHATDSEWTHLSQEGDESNPWSSWDTPDPCAPSWDDINPYPEPWDSRDSWYDPPTPMKPEVPEPLHVPEPVHVSEPEQVSDMISLSDVSDDSDDSDVIESEESSDSTLVYREPPKRYDSMDGNWYTQEEFYDYYGSHDIWKAMHPTGHLMRSHLYYIFQKYHHLEYKKLRLLTNEIMDTL
jgi:hypothetical protein